MIAAGDMRNKRSRGAGGLAGNANPKTIIPNREASKKLRSQATWLSARCSDLSLDVCRRIELGGFAKIAG